MGEVTPTVLLDLLKKEEDRRLAEDSLYDFVIQAWPTVEPGVDFVGGWHIRTICEHLEAVTNGEIKRLLVNIPPRMSKSTIVSVIWPMWEWIRHPEEKFLCASYSGTLATRDNLKARRLIQSPWYQERWGDVFKLSGDQNAKQRFENDHTGYRIATSVGGTATGEGGSRLICLHKNSYIETDHGPVKIGDLVDKQMQVKVLAYDHDKQVAVLSEILRFEKSEGRRSLKLVTSSTDIIATHDHPVFVKGKGYTQLSEVQPGDCLLRCVRERAESKTIANCSCEKSSVRKNVQGRVSTPICKCGELPSVWKENKTCPCTCEESREDILQPQVPRVMGAYSVYRGGRWDATLHLFSMWKNFQPKKETRKIRKNILFARLYEQCTTPTKNTSGKSVQGLWKSIFCNTISGGYTPYVFPRLWGYIKKQKAKRHKQRKVCSWKRGRKIPIRVQARVCDSQGKGQSVQMVWANGARAWCSTTRSSYRLRQREQQTGEFDNFVQVLPWWNARECKVETKLVEDVVIAIEPIETPDFVYNVAVENHHNYFANGILLHNCDDPHSAQEAQSDVVRETALDWFSSVWSTRLNNAKKDVMVTVMQRLHEADVSGYILDTLRSWDHICLPMEYDGKKRKTSLGFYDPRTKENELLCPERVGPEELIELKKYLGTYGSSGQLQQDPTPTGGGILDTRYIEFWPHDKGLPQFEYILQSYDTAFSEKTAGDPTACTVWAIFTHRGRRNVMLVDAWDDHLSYPDLRNKVINDWSVEYGGSNDQNPFAKGRRPDRILVEEKASGQSLLQDLRLARVPAIGYNPGKADKISRAHQAAPTLESGFVWVPESKKNPGHHVSWASNFIKQLAKFPVAEHDDYVDTFTQAIIMLKNDHFFDLPVAKDYDEPKPRTKEKVNPYAA